MVATLESYLNAMRNVLAEKRLRDEAARYLIENNEVKSDEEACALGYLDLWNEIDGAREPLDVSGL